MSRSRRVYTIAAALTLAGGAASTVVAQIPGMPLFTNPRYGTGLRVHADMGKPTEDDPSRGDLTVYQAGVSLAIWRLGVNANVGTTKATATAAQGCVASPTVSCANSTATISALTQLRIMGGGQSNFSLALFAGGSLDLDSSDANCTTAGCDPNLNDKKINVPVGVSLGYHVNLPVLSSLNVWAAPRMNMTRFINCTASAGHTCTAPKSQFGWAVGVDMPLFRILSIRAAYDSHKVGSTTINVMGVGASIGIGGMR